MKTGAVFFSQNNTKKLLRLILSPYFSQLAQKLYGQDMRESAKAYTTKSSVDALDEVFDEKVIKLRIEACTVSQSKSL
jgi:hypothetical protein